MQFKPPYLKELRSHLDSKQKIPYDFPIMRIPSPLDLRNDFPASFEVASFISETRRKSAEILQRKDPRLALIVGPCSIHNPDLALDYAAKLLELSKEVENFYPIMRVFLEKPRTRSGWKGLVYDPHLDGSDDIASGLRISRKILLELAKLEVPAATELLEPLVVPYLEDLIAWGMIGARTSASQPHRQLASGLPFPVGFKNDIHGELDVAICGILSSRQSHTHIGIDDHGLIAALKTKGNPLAHLVLRGSESKPNFDPSSVALGISALKNNGLDPQIIIDCSHGNSGKDPKRQPIAFESVIDQAMSGNTSIAGLMLESHLLPGKQPLNCRPEQLLYGVSITDSCLGWEETVALILSADDKLSRSMSMSSVQK